MSTHHSETHDIQLRALALGELDATSMEGEAARRELEACPVCRVRLHEQQGLVDGFASIRDEAEELVLAALGETATATEDALVQSFADRGRERPVGNAGLRWGVFATLAAGLLLVFGVITWGPSRTLEAPLPGGTLGPEDIECLSPIGIEEAFRSFSWRCAVEGVRFDLRIFDHENNLLLTERGLEESTWTPTDAQRRELPRKIRWRVVARDVTTAEVASGEAEASTPSSH